MSVQVARRRYHRGSSFLRRSSGASGASGGARGGNGARGACAPNGGSGPCGGSGLCSSGPAFSCEWCAYALSILARSSSARMAASTMGANRMCCRGSKARYGSHGGGGYAGSDGGGRGGSLRSSWNNEGIGKQTERIHSTISKHTRGAYLGRFGRAVPERRPRPHALHFALALFPALAVLAVPPLALFPVAARALALLLVPARLRGGDGRGRAQPPRVVQQRRRVVHAVQRRRERQVPPIRWQTERGRCAGKRAGAVPRERRYTWNFCRFVTTLYNRKYMSSGENSATDYEWDKVIGGCYLDAGDVASRARAAARKANGKVAAVRAQGRRAACPCRRRAQRRQISLSAGDCRSPTRFVRASRSTFPSSAMVSLRLRFLSKAITS